MVFGFINWVKRGKWERKNQNLNPTEKAVMRHTFFLGMKETRVKEQMYPHIGARDVVLRNGRTPSLTQISNQRIPWLRDGICGLKTWPPRAQESLMCYSQVQPGCSSLLECVRSLLHSLMFLQRSQNSAQTADSPVLRLRAHWSLGVLSFQSENLGSVIMPQSQVPDCLTLGGQRYRRSIRQQSCCFCQRMWGTWWQ